jgi:hypothetical protein
MQEPLDVLERRIDELRAAVRAALSERDVPRVRALQAELQRTQRAWDLLVSLPEDEEASHTQRAATDEAWYPYAGGATPLLPARELVHRVLTILRVPAAPRLIVEVHSAFFSEGLPASRLSTLRRDEERSYHASPNSRPYYLCPALNHDSLACARGLLTVSTWPIEKRIVGPLSARVDFLNVAIRIAGLMQGPPGGPHTDASPRAVRLLNRYALNIPGGTAPDADHDADPQTVISAAETELEVHENEDRRARQAGARRALRIPESARLFGVRLEIVREQGGQR